MSSVYEENVECPVWISTEDEGGFRNRQGRMEADGGSDPPRPWRRPSEGGEAE